MDAKRISPEENDIMGTLIARGEHYDISDTIYARCILPPDQHQHLNEIVLPSLAHNKDLTVNNPDRRYESETMSRAELKRLVDDPRDDVSIPIPRVRQGIPRKPLGPFAPPDNTKIVSYATPLRDKAAIKLYTERAKRRDTDLLAGSPQRIILYHALLASEYRGKDWYQCKGTQKWADSLRFDARFESGNLFTAVRILGTQQYELMVNPDYETCEHMSWFYFAIGNVRKGVRYTFKVLNYIKPQCMFCEGAGIPTYIPTQHKKGWQRLGDEICYYPNTTKRRGEYYYKQVENIYLNPIVESAPAPTRSKSASSKSATKSKGTDSKKDGKKSSKKKVVKTPVDALGTHYTLSFCMTFKQDHDIVFLASAIPYTFTDLNRYLEQLQSTPLIRIEKLTRSLMGNNCRVITLGTSSQEKELILVLARIHPGEPSGNYVLQGFLDFLSGRRDAELKRYISWLVAHLEESRLMHDSLQGSPRLKDSLNQTTLESSKHEGDCDETQEEAKDSTTMAAGTPKMTFNPDGSRPLPPQLYQPKDLPAPTDLFAFAGNYYGVDEKYRRNSPLTADEVKELRLRLYKNELLRKFLLEKYLFKIIPMVNPDGVILGNSRVNVERIDMAHHWPLATNLNCPELFAIRELINEHVIEQKYELKFIIDMHATTHQPNFFLHTNESIDYMNLRRLFWESCGQQGLIPNLGLENITSFFTHDIISINTLLNDARERAREAERVSKDREKDRDATQLPSAKGAEKDMFDRLYKEAMERHMATKNAIFGNNSYESMLRQNVDTDRAASQYEDGFIHFVGADIMESEFARNLFHKDDRTSPPPSSRRSARRFSTEQNETFLNQSIDEPRVKAVYKYTVNPNEYALIHKQIMMSAYKNIQENKSRAISPSPGVGVRFSNDTKAESPRRLTTTIPEESPYRLTFSEMVYPILLAENGENYLFDIASCTYNDNSSVKPNSLRTYAAKVWGCDNIYVAESSLYGTNRLEVEHSEKAILYGGIVNASRYELGVLDESYDSSTELEGGGSIDQGTIGSQIQIPQSNGTSLSAVDPCAMDLDDPAVLADKEKPFIVPLNKKGVTTVTDTRVFTSDWADFNRHLVPADYFIYGEALIMTLGLMFDKNCEAMTAELEKLRADYVTWIKHSFNHLITNPRRDIVGFDLDKLPMSLKLKLKERIHIFSQFEAQSGTEFDHVVRINKTINTTKVFNFLDPEGYDRPMSDSDDSQPIEYEVSEVEQKKAEKLKTKEQRLQEKRERLELRDCVRTMVMEQLNPEKLRKQQEKGKKGVKSAKGSRISTAHETTRFMSTTALGMTSLMGDSMMGGVRVQDAQSSVFIDPGRFRPGLDTPDISRIVGPDDTMRSMKLGGDISEDESRKAA
ncbi:putative Carboxypeptidase [Giardia muris]|uniref:Putative Carboxypeptidase n=1 Tax=Giardia muris TaxID=5742 RepID=A0A4Z1SZS1_GIAMU|nr:putative Carboxypeptidase [Giardia muris]|eukprot:TNJ30245.1 putative Carboxypeptidase [Giardia muris]